ncbi:MAG: 3-phosphoglycerate dehydrogenase family protein [Firmicutes bacterium]|nr:3-phosphoglycerate dehydrogenase family protein [Bacillota bacterium]
MAVKNVLKLNKLGKLADQVFGDNYKLHDAYENPDAIIVRSFDMKTPYVLPESVLCVARAGAGTNNIPSKDYAEKGVVVFNTPGANANAVKELCICAILLSGRKIVDGINWAGSLKEGDPSVAKQVEDGKKNFVGGEILGKNIGIIGMGAIGILTAEAAASLGMNVFGYDPNMTPEKQKKLDKRVKMAKTLDEIYANCQFISLHLPFLPETKEMINADVLNKCVDGVNIINCARAELVQNQAIIDGLKSGKVNRYVTDFPVGTVLNIPGIITIPHLGASTPEAEDNCVSMGGAQIIDFIENGNIVNSVNYPALTLAKTPKTNVRMTICYKGNLDIKKLAKEAKINVIGFALATKGDFGYAIIDSDNINKANCQCKDLKPIEGILKVRCFDN